MLDRQAQLPERVAVVGVGYVGLTLLCALARAGFSALGYDIDARKVQLIAQGDVPFDGAEPAMAELLSSMVRQQHVTATTDPTMLRQVEALFIAVETPVDDQHQPQYAALKSALATIGPYLSPGVLVVVESTIGPGTIHGVVLPALELSTGGTVGKDFHLVHCPERVMPGKLLLNISTCDRVVGGVTPSCTARAMAIYPKITCGKLYPTNAITAEIVKTSENAYRDVQIAFANELALLCEELGANVYEVRELVNSSPERNMHLPGAGVGGHCIPKDPWLLCSSVSKYQPRLLPIARAINDGMPNHLVTLLQDAFKEVGRTVAGSTVTILGASYLAESDDVRNTPALPLANQLLELGASVKLLDPYVTQLDQFPVSQDLSALGGSDALILVTAHQMFKDLSLTDCARRMHTPVLVDGRNVFDALLARDAGYCYRGIGKG